MNIKEERILQQLFNIKFNMSITTHSDVCKELFSLFNSENEVIKLYRRIKTYPEALEHATDRLSKLSKSEIGHQLVQNPIKNNQK